MSAVQGRALAPVSPVCRLIESLSDLLDERKWERRGHGQANGDKRLLGHLKVSKIMR